MDGFRFNEKYLSQIPALQQLINLGFDYLTPEQALLERQTKKANVLLEGILREQLKKINRIHYKGQQYLFSEENVQSAVQKLKSVKFDGLQKTNEAIYDLLTLGSAMEQTIEGAAKSFNLNFIDWRHPDRNAFHVTAEFSVERARRMETARPDIVLFVNGIPLAVIECKSPDIEIEKAIAQSVRNQSDDYIPDLFVFAQMVLGVNKNAVRYATTGTSARYWSVWKELQDAESAVAASINKPLTDNQKSALFSGDFIYARDYFDALEQEGERRLTEQDKGIFSLCRPERLLDIAYNFTIFENGIKKIARYQQYFVVKSTLARVKQLDGKGRRQGGIIWHTQGSGKSLTMIWLARNLVLDSDITNPRIVLVTDRKDLDIQLGNTFSVCGLDPERAKTGRDLLELVAEKKAGIVTTLIHKFDKALKAKPFADDSSDIFMLVDESHRTNFGAFSARMRQMFPQACYIGFTGTPLMKSEKNNFVRFGGLIEPHYSINQAVEDGAVVRLLYEGRHVEMTQNKQAIDLWFERHTQGLNKEQQADLKKKYARAEMLNKAQQVVYMRAFDISEHFRAHWQGTGFKAQLVAPGKESAIQYQEYLSEIGYVSSEVVISAPDKREGYEEVDDEPVDSVLKFWQKMMKRYGSEEEYNKQIINQFKYGDEPEILIVVDKLLTGFDAPRNTILYLCRRLREHTLLQAIARVNRVYEAKEFGYIIDYASILGELDKALTSYNELSGFEEADLVGALKSLNEEVEKLPQKYSDLWDIFREVKHLHDEEAYESLLADKNIRDDFYECLSEYTKCLHMALSSERFLSEASQKKIDQYKNDLKRFQKLRASVKLRFSDAIDYRDYEPKLKKLLDTHIQADQVTQLNKPVDIFDESTFDQVKEEQGVYSAKTAASRADTIAYATKKAISEKMEDDPAFYEKFSILIQQAIDDFRSKRISDIEYLRQVVDISQKVKAGKHDDIPSSLDGNGYAMAVFGIIRPYFSENSSQLKGDEIAADAAMRIHEIFQSHWKVQFWDDADAQKRVMNDIDDFLFDELKGDKGVNLSVEQMDEIIERSLHIAKRWMN